MEIALDCVLSVNGCMRNTMSIRAEDTDSIRWTLCTERCGSSNTKKAGNHSSQEYRRRSYR